MKTWKSAWKTWEKITSEINKQQHRNWTCDMCPAPETKPNSVDGVMRHETAWLLPHPAELRPWHCVVALFEGSTLYQQSGKAPPRCIEGGFKNHTCTRFRTELPWELQYLKFEDVSAMSSTFRIFVTHISVYSLYYMIIWAYIKTHKGRRVRRTCTSTFSHRFQLGDFCSQVKNLQQVILCQGYNVPGVMSGVVSGWSLNTCLTMFGWCLRDVWVYSDKVCLCMSWKVGDQKHAMPWIQRPSAKRKSEQSQEKSNNIYIYMYI